MLFNSLPYLIFIPIVFFSYWYIFNRSLKLQNLFLIGASYLFYGWWDWRFLGLIIFSSTVDYLIGLQLGKTEKKKDRRSLLWISILVNVGFLGFFKYFNFFVESFIDAFSFFGLQLHANTLSIVLPVGISFYTFQTMSYTFDVYKKRVPPTNDVIAFFAYVSFFPQLVAGPIERAERFLSQFLEKRSFNYGEAVDGMRQILWGFFKKIAIADNCAVYVDQIFGNPDAYPSSTLFLGAVLFAFQIYGDFSGYSDIAIGTARLFGFNLMQNFAYPYFSRDIAEFWRRWHISLSTWFRDYLYIPLGGSWGGKWLTVRNLFIIFIVSGFWHGANWTFIIWGALHALYFLPLFLTERNRVHMDVVAKNRWFPSIKEFFQIGITFLLTTFAWIFFRAETVTGAWSYLSAIFSRDILAYPAGSGLTAVWHLLLFMIVIEWIQREESHGLTGGVFNNRFLRWALYFALFFMIMLLGNFTGSDFIYFQF
ncbi:MBOAT family O-acyltransferase [Rhodohalobacter sp. 8-1]|uniref:MBOAT family O-acyltransferase n=1 Tax=Rhodohalobacter sp. 8-1 TaxID=3131972 RepID=UPI0030ED22BE